MCRLAVWLSLMTAAAAADNGRGRLSSPGGRHERGRDDDAAREAALEAEFDRERQRQRALQAEQQRREERELQRRLDLIERHERLVVVPVQASPSTLRCSFPLTVRRSAQHARGHKSGSTRGPISCFQSGGRSALL